MVNAKQEACSETGTSALITNAQAIAVVAQAVESTLGPKGLDTMLLDRFGDVIITNDGITILKMMDVEHPAAQMLINLAAAQQREIGDGTTTATLLAGTLVSEGVKQIRKGVPIIKVIAGIVAGIEKACQILQEKAISLTTEQESLLFDTAQIAARGNADIANLICKAFSFFDSKTLAEPTFKLTEHVQAVKGAGNQVVSGVIINKLPLNEEMPRSLKNAKVLIIDDTLAPEEIVGDALHTEIGFQEQLKLEKLFRENLDKIISLGVNLVIVDRGITELAEEVFTTAGMLVLQRVSHKEWRRAAKFAGARALKKTALNQPANILNQYLGAVAQVQVVEELKQVYLMGGQGKPQATILVAAATEEVVAERERIAKDAAAALQAALKGGVVPGGGVTELAVARELQKYRQEVSGMAVYGWDCVCQALQKPFMQIVANAGFNALEKLGEVNAAQLNTGKSSLGIDCESGEIVDLASLGIYDPLLVKIKALQTASEVATAILRIDTIIKKKENEG